VFFPVIYDFDVKMYDAFELIYEVEASASAGAFGAVFAVGEKLQFT
jgi:hypothetical protein